MEPTYYDGAEYVHDTVMSDEVPTWSKSDTEWVIKHLNTTKKNEHTLSYVKAAVFTTWSRLRFICGQDASDKRSDIQRLQAQCTQLNLSTRSVSGKSRTCAQMFKVLLYHFSMVHPTEELCEERNGMFFVQRVLHDFAARQSQSKEGSTFTEWWEMTMKKVLGKDIVGTPLHSKSTLAYLPRTTVISRSRKAKKRSTTPDLA